MTLLDASVIIDSLRAKDYTLLETMKSGGAVCGVTRAEILSGTRGPADRVRLTTILDEFQQVAIPEAMWDTVGATIAELRANGLTVPLADVVVTTAAIALDCAVWARDAHFQAIQRVVPRLQLFREL